ncbi:MAG TPA: hypothetical protein VHS31_06845 [Tepidisphaeraceae bacterium]|jgi:hypothetical protein|nr:hypothetical protein [Tepidisphaeraceae bacterium]
MNAALSRFAEYLLGRNREVLVVGPHGAGKTSLVALLVGSPERTQPRLESSKENATTVGVLGTNTVLFHDVLDVKLLRQMPRVSPMGVIIVVANGFYEARNPRQQAAGGVTEILHRNRHAEQIFLKEDVDLCFHLIDRARHRIDWTLTVVNKADLWWDQRTSVEEYYRHDFRRTLLDVMRRHPSTQEAMPITGFMSCRIQRFMESTLPSAKFDDDESYRLKDDVLGKLKSAISHSVSEQ